MIKGERFARLVALEPTVRAKSGNEQWLFRCDCGGIVTARTVDVRRGFKQSCGCLQKGRAAANKRLVLTKHGWCYTTEYETWAQLIQRCIAECACGSTAKRLSSRCFCC
jgi:hypothetical protein